MVSRRNQAIDDVNEVTKAVWPDAEIKIYGSTVTGLWVQDSDLDVCVDLDLRFGVGMHIEQLSREML